MRRPVDPVRRQEEQDAQATCRALHVLHGFRFPETRARAITANAKRADAVEPAARAMWTPQNLRAIAGWLTILADELAQDEDHEQQLAGHRDLGVADCARVISALENYAHNNPDEEEVAGPYRRLAAEIAGADRLVLIHRHLPEGVPE